MIVMGDRRYSSNQGGMWEYACLGDDLSFPSLPWLVGIKDPLAGVPSPAASCGACDTPRDFGEGRP